MKKIIITILISCLAFSSTLVSFADSNMDTLSVDSASEWSKELIKEAAKDGIYTDQIMSEFKTNITREEFTEVVMALYDSLGAKDGQQVVQTGQFMDVENRQITRAYNLKFINGVEEGIFEPYANLTREQMAVIYANFYTKILEIDGVTANVDTITDKDEISSWAKSSVALCNEENILSGVGNGKFNPKGTVTREQGIIGINKLYKIMQTKVKTNLNSETVATAPDESEKSTPEDYIFHANNSEKYEARYYFNEKTNEFNIIDNDSILSSLVINFNLSGGSYGEIVDYVITFENTSLDTTTTNLSTLIEDDLSLTLKEYGTYTINTIIKNDFGNQILPIFKMYYHPKSNNLTVAAKTKSNNHCPTSFDDKYGTDGSVMLKITYNNAEKSIDYATLSKKDYNDFEAGEYTSYDVPTFSNYGFENVEKIQVYKDGGGYWKPEEFYFINDRGDLIAKTIADTWVNNNLLTIYSKGKTHMNLTSANMIAFTIKTSNISKSGTDDQVFINVYFKDGRKLKKELDKSSDDFEAGDIATYQVPLGNGRNTSEIEKVTIYTTHMKDDAWRPDYVKILDDDGTTFSYKSLNYIVGVDEVEVYNANKPAESLSNTTVLNVYVSVGNVEHAGTDDEIRLDFFYAGETSAYSIVIDTPDYDDFEKGSYKMYTVFMRDGDNFENTNYIDFRNTGDDGVYIESISVYTQDNRLLFSKYINDFVDDNYVNIYSK